MVSNIDATKPVDGVPAVKQDIRDNWTAAKTEVESLQGETASISTPLGTPSVFPLGALRAVNQGLSPFHFTPDPTFIGRGAAKRLSTEYATVADAQMAFPLVASDLAGQDLSDITFDEVALQSMSEAAQQNGNGVPLQQVPSGIFDVRTWKVVRGDAFRTAEVRGAGRGKGSDLAGTCIRSYVGDRPCVSIQGARHVKFGGLTLQGINTAGSYSSGKLAAKDPSLWSLGPSTINEGRYSPYVGLAVDPYTTDPGSGQGYSSDPYGRGTSSQVHISDVHLQWFYAGFGVGLSDDAELGDSLTLFKVDCNANAYGCVSGGSQNRILSYLDGYMEGGFRCFDNTTFGRGAGNAFQVSNLVMVLFYELFNYSDTDPITFDSAHLEQFVRLGTYIGGVQKFPFTMRNSHVKFWGSLDDSVHRPASHMLNKGGRAVFSATRFDTVTSAATSFPGLFNFIGRGAADYVFTESCTFFQNAIQPNRCRIGYSRLDENPVKHDGTVFSSGLSADNSQVAVRQGGLDDVVNVSSIANQGMNLPARIGASVRTHTVHIRGAGTFRYEPGSVVPGISVPGVTNPSITDQTYDVGGTSYDYRRLQFDTTDAAMFQLNDILAARHLEDSPTETMIGYVENISGSTVDVFLTVDDAELVSPVTALQLVVHSEWAPRTSPQGVCSTSLDTVTFSTDISDTIYPGDHIQGSAGTWTNFRVVSVAGDGLSLVLNKNAPVTGVVDLYWGRLHELTGTAQ